MSKRNTIDYVCYNKKCKHNDNGFCQLKGMKPNSCISAISKQGYELGIEWRDKQIADLEAKLDEKEKQIETQKRNIEFLYDLFVSPQGEQTLKAINQDKISFAVEQLEKVKTNILSNITFGIESVGIMNSIDNQIEELKKEMT